MHLGSHYFTRYLKCGGRAVYNGANLCGERCGVVLGWPPYGTRVLWLCDRGRADRGGTWKGLVSYGCLL